MLKMPMQRSEPDNKVVRVDLRPAAAVQQDARVPHYGTASVMLVLHGRRGWQEVVESLGDVCGAVAVKDIVDDVPWLQRALQDRDVSLWIKKSENILSVKRQNELVFFRPDHTELTVKMLLEGGGSA